MAGSSKCLQIAPSGASATLAIKSGRLSSQPEFHLEFLVTCLWLPLMDPMDPMEHPIHGPNFAHPLRVDGFSTETSCRLAPKNLRAQVDLLGWMIQHAMAGAVVDGLPFAKR